MYGRTDRMFPSVFLEEAGKAFRVLGKPSGTFTGGGGYAMGGASATGGGYGISTGYSKREFNKTNPHGTFGKQIPDSYSSAGSGVVQAGVHGNSDSRFAEVAEKYSKGAIIYHDDYGTGQIVATGENSGEYVITVQFENGSRKKFLPQYQARSLMIVKD